MEREFLMGANLPWMHYGIDFGANAWQPDGGLSRPAERERLDRVFDRLAREGNRCIRWFLLCDGRAGIRFGPDGCPQALDASVMADLDVALQAAERHALQLMFVLFDFHWCRPAEDCRGVQLCGRSAVLADDRQRAALLDRIVAPLLAHCGTHPSIFAWDIINEPEWIDTVSTTTLRRFFEESAALVHAITTQPVTIGSAGMRWRSMYTDVHLDFHQVHWYDRLTRQPSLDTSVTSLGFDRPVILGEFPTRGSRFRSDEIVRTAREAGYAGALYWSALSRDEFSSSHAIEGYSHRRGS